MLPRGTSISTNGSDENKTLKTLPSHVFYLVTLFLFVQRYLVCFHSAPMYAHQRYLVRFPIFFRSATRSASIDVYISTPLHATFFTSVALLVVLSLLYVSTNTYTSLLAPKAFLSTVEYYDTF